MEDELNGLTDDYEMGDEGDLADDYEMEGELDEMMRGSEENLDEREEELTVFPISFSDLDKIKPEALKGLIDFSEICQVMMYGGGGKAGMEDFFIKNTKLIFPIIFPRGNIRKEILLVLRRKDFDNIKKGDSISKIVTVDLINSSVAHCVAILNQYENKQIATLYYFCVHYATAEVEVERTAKYFQSILQYIYVQPQIDFIWIGIAIKLFNEQLFKLLAHFRFATPYISQNDPWGNKLDVSIMLARPNGYLEPATEKTRKDLYGECFYSIIKFEKLLENEPCSITLRFNRPFAKWLEYLPEKGVIPQMVEGKMTTEYTSHEVSSAMGIVNPVVNKKRTNVRWEIVGLPNTVLKGTEINVGDPGGRYNYHTHPEGVYRKLDVRYAFPSGPDASAFLGIMRRGTVCHFVVTLEGIYILSPTREFVIYYKETMDFLEQQGIGNWINEIQKRSDALTQTYDLPLKEYKQKVIAELVQKAYEQPLKKRINPKVYVMEMNLLRGHTAERLRSIGLTKNPIHFEFVDWPTVKSGYTFTVYFLEISKQCFPNEDNIRAYKHFDPTPLAVRW